MDKIDILNNQKQEILSELQNQCSEEQLIFIRRKMMENLEDGFIKHISPDDENNIFQDDANLCLGVSALFSYKNAIMAFRLDLPDYHTAFLASASWSHACFSRKERTIEILTNRFTEFKRCVKSEGGSVGGHFRWKNQEGHNNQESLRREAFELIKSKVESGEKPGWFHSDFIKWVFDHCKDSKGNSFEGINKRTLKNETAKMFREMGLGVRVRGGNSRSKQPK